jgi:hypothetical protein
MPSGTPKKSPKNLPVGRNTGSKTKTGSSTQKNKRKRPVPRFYEVKIRITAEEYVRGLPYFEEQKYLSKFVLDSYRERLNRNEANSKVARLRILAGNVELLKPVIKEMYEQGKLRYLYEHGRNDGGDNGKA